MMRLALPCCAAVVALSCGADPSVLVRVEFAPSVDIDQVRAAVAHQERVLGPVTLPEKASAPLTSGATLRLLLPADAQGAPVAVKVEGMARGAVVAVGETAVALEPGREPAVTVSLSSLLPCVGEGCAYPSPGPVPNPVCNRDNCRGCCGPDGVCRRGDQAEACGMGGAACAGCASGKCKRNRCEGD